MKVKINNKEKEIEKLSLIETARCYNFYKKNLDCLLENDKKVFESLKLNYIELMRWRLWDQGEDLMIAMGYQKKDIVNLKIIDKIFMSHPDYKMPLTYFITLEDITIEKLLKINKELKMMIDNQRKTA